jgi:hypothetical protein
MKTTAMLREWLTQANVRIQGAKKIIKFAPYLLTVSHVDNGSLPPSNATQVTKLVAVLRLPVPAVELDARLWTKFQTVSIVSRLLRNLDAKCCKSECLSPTRLIFVASVGKIVYYSLHDNPEAIVYGGSIALLAWQG